MTLTIPDHFERGSVFSSDRKYRYSLFRRWNKYPMVLFVMLNPSIADDSQDDPTQLQCRKFAEGAGYGGYYVGNLFAFVSTDPRALEADGYPIGPDNDFHLARLQEKTVRSIVAWGCQGDLAHRRALKVAYILRTTRELYALGTTSDGCPRHPLYLKEIVKTQPILFRGCS